MTVVETLSELVPYTLLITLNTLDKEDVGDTDIRTSLGKSLAETDSELAECSVTITTEILEWKFPVEA